MRGLICLGCINRIALGCRRKMQSYEDKGRWENDCKRKSISYKKVTAMYLIWAISEQYYFILDS